MPDRVIAPACEPLDLDEAMAQMSDAGFRPDCTEALQSAARILAGLQANRNLLTPFLLAELEHRAGQPEARKRYTGQTIELGTDAAAGYVLRANIWPSAEDPLMQRPGAEVFQYGFAHDHNFDFLTIGYHGPGYRSEFFAYDYAAITGYVGEAVRLTPLPPITLAEGTMLHYRAQQDVHRQLPPESLSISLNIVHVHPRQGWFDQYGFDVESGQISRILSHSPIEALLAMASLLKSEDARGAVDALMQKHPSPAVRLSAAQALAQWHRQDGGDLHAYWEQAAATSDCLKIQHYAKGQLAAPPPATL